MFILFGMFEGMGKRTSDKDVQKDLNAQLHEKNHRDFDIEVSNEILSKAYAEIPDFSVIKKQIEDLLKGTLEGADETDISVLVNGFAFELHKENEYTLLESLKDKVHPEVIYEAEQNLFQWGGSNAHRWFDWLGASDMTFVFSDLKTNPKTGVMYADEYRADRKKSRYELVKKAQEILNNAGLNARSI